MDEESIEQKLSDVEPSQDDSVSVTSTEQEDRSSDSLSESSEEPEMTIQTGEPSEIRNVNGAAAEVASGSEFVFPERVYSSSTIYSAFLDRADLWREFHKQGTEMVVTKTGRRMFPPMKVQLMDLNPATCYVLLVDVTPCDEYRYKYQNYSWQKCFKEDCQSTRYYVHPDSPALGAHWMKSLVSFYKLKLTNNQLDNKNNLIVNSMHKYQPRLHIVEATCTDIDVLNTREFHTIVFPGTQFITVTAYQNEKITQLKINNNPFAKGFRSPFSRVRTRSKNQDQRCGSTGSDSSTEESSATPSVIQSGPNFPPHREYKKIVRSNERKAKSPYTVTPPQMGSIHSPVLYANTSQSLHRAQLNIKSNKDGHHRIIRPDPASGQNVPTQPLLQPAAPLVPGGHIEVNGIRYLLVLAPNGQPTLVPVCPPAIVSSPPVFTSAPLQLISTASLGSPVFPSPQLQTLPSNKSLPPPLLPINAAAHSTPVLASSSSTVSLPEQAKIEKNSQNELVYIPSHQASAQKLIILKHVSPVLMPNDKVRKDSLNSEDNLTTNVPIYRFNGITQSN